jgi:Peptidase M15
MAMDYQQPIVPGGSFSWAEYALLQQWNAFAIPTQANYQNALFLFTQLQPLRQQLGRPLTITSGARTPQYTQFLRSQGIPAALQSAHMDWAGVDLTCPGMSNGDLWRWLDARWLGRMEVLSATPTWCHLDTRNWGQKLRFKP